MSRTLTLNRGFAGRGIPRRAPKDGITPPSIPQNNAIVLPKSAGVLPREGLHDSGHRHQSQNLGAKFMTPEQAHLPHGRNLRELATSCLASVLPILLLSANGAPSSAAAMALHLSRSHPQLGPVSPVTTLPFLASYSQKLHNAPSRPTACPTISLRTPVTVVAGQNSTNVVNTTPSTRCCPASPSPRSMPTIRPHECR